MITIQVNVTENVETSGSASASVVGSSCVPALKELDLTNLEQIYFPK